MSALTVKYGANDDVGFLPGHPNGSVNLFGQIGTGHLAHPYNGALGHNDGGGLCPVGIRLSTSATRAPLRPSPVKSCECPLVGGPAHRDGLKLARRVFRSMLATLGFEELTSCEGRLTHDACYRAADGLDRANKAATSSLIGVLSKEKCNARLRTARNRYCDCGNCVARSQSLNYHWLRCRRVTAPSLTVRVTYCYGRFKCLWFELSMLAQRSPAERN